MHRMYAIAIAVFLCCWASVAATAANRDRHVIVVCIDGLAAYLLDDPKAPLPTIRALAKDGVVAEGGMQVVNPSITWPNHTSIVTGTRPEKHGVLANGVLVRGAVGLPTVVDPKRDQKDLIHMPTIFDAAQAAGLITGEINWPCTRGSKTLRDSFPDVPDQVTHMTPALRKELIEAGILLDDTQATFAANSVVGRDLIWTEAAAHIIRNRKPNLLFVHLLNCDSTHHLLGPQTPAGYTANAYADMCLAKIVAATKEAGIYDKTTFIVLADHGFTTTPQAICPNVLLRDAKLLTVTAGKLADARVHVVPEGGIGLVYCADPSTAAADRDKAAALFKDQEGIADFVTPERFGELGIPHPREHAQSPDAVLVAKDGYAVSASVTGDSLVVANTEVKASLGSHGFVSTFAKMNAICIFNGNGVRRGATVKELKNIDIAPTIAKLLAVDFPSADGRVVSGALRE